MAELKVSVVGWIPLPSHTSDKNPAHTRLARQSQEFDALLSATITAPRLSGSKVQKLAALATQLVAEDHHIVTTFFKLNASLPSATQARISSLYVFDAIAREARSDVNKGKGKEINQQRGKGTQAGLLLKLEGVVDSWIDGMLEDGKGSLWVEGKEKTRKIIDIWTKNGTFPQYCLDRLSLKVANAGAGPSHPSESAVQVQTSGSGSGIKGGNGQGSTTPPYPPPVSAPWLAAATAAAPSSSSSSSSNPPGSLPAEILKMLGIATTPTAGSHTPPPPASSLPTPIGGAGPSTPNIANVAAPPAAPASAPATTAMPTGIDIAAILASVNRQAMPTPAPINAPAANPPQQGLPFPAAGPSSNPALQPPAGMPDLSKLTGLIPANLVPAPSQNQANGPSSAVQAQIGQNPSLNTTQQAALAKFAALAQAGPPPPPSMSSAAAAVAPAPPPFQRNTSSGPVIPQGAAFSHSPAHQSIVSGTGYAVPSAGASAGMASGGYGQSRSPKNGFHGDRRGSYERDGKPYDTQGGYSQRHEAGAGPGPSRSGGFAGRGNRRGGGGGITFDGGRRRDRSASPNRDREQGRGQSQGYRGRLEQSSDGGWGNARRGRGGTMGQTEQRPYNGQVRTSGSSGFDDSYNQSQGGQTYASKGPSQPPSTGDQRGPAAVPSAGRAPPPAWMNEGDSGEADRHGGRGASGNNPSEEEQGEGEEDMKLDEDSDNDDEGDSSKLAPQRGSDHAVSGDRHVPSSGWEAFPQQRIHNQNQNQSYGPSSYNHSHNDNDNGYPPSASSQNAYTAPGLGPGTGPGDAPMHHRNSDQFQPQPLQRLETFDISSFDPTSPESWISLGEAWKNTMGREPNQMELMAFLAGGGGGGGGGMGMGIGLGMGMGMNGNGHGN
ncbi:hypothetical protein I317_06666 [Kwoniella heveanensis CBS 569]|nr:hypothetical protein I317_06666 [Kwoniella heveanensis CBS 569]